MSRTAWHMLVYLSGFVLCSLNRVRNTYCVDDDDEEKEQVSRTAQTRTTWEVHFCYLVWISDYRSKGFGHTCNDKILCWAQPTCEGNNSLNKGLMQIYRIKKRRVQTEVYLEKGSSWTIRMIYPFHTD